MIDKKFSAGYEDISVTVVDYQRFLVILPIALVRFISNQKNALRNTQMKLIN